MYFQMEDVLVKEKDFSEDNIESVFSVWNLIAVTLIGRKNLNRGVLHMYFDTCSRGIFYIS